MPTEHILEVGPGTGNLTVLLLERAAAVTAVELDDDLYEMLLSRIHRIGLSERLHAIHGDFLSVDIPKVDALVANVPYQISSPLLQRVFSLPADRQPERSVLLLQKEFVDRMIAQPGTRQYSRLSVTCSMFADVSSALFVPRSHFRPPPKVDSAVAVVTHRPERAAAAGVPFGEFNAMLRDCFAGKNKTLRSLFLKKSAIRRMLLRQRAAEALVDDSPESTGKTTNRTHATSSRRSEVTETEVSDARVEVEASLLQAGLAELRANAMPLEAFLELYHCTVEAGFAWGGRIA